MIFCLRVCHEWKIVSSIRDSFMGFHFPPYPTLKITYANSILAIIYNSYNLAIPSPSVNWNFMKKTKTGGLLEWFNNCDGQTMEMYSIISFGSYTRVLIALERFSTSVNDLMRVVVGGQRRWECVNLVNNLLICSQAFMIYFWRKFSSRNLF